MRRSRLQFALVLREFSAGWVIGCFVIISGAFWSASFAAHNPSYSPFARLLRRFDLTLLAVVALLSALRVAQRICDDHRHGWTEPYFAAGGARRDYSLLLLSAVVAAGSAWFAAGAASFALGVRLFDNTPELLYALPALVPAGILLLTCVVIYAASFAYVLRDALSSVMVATLLAAIPFVLLLSLTGDDGEVPLSLWLWNISYPPPLTLAHSAASLARQCVYVALGAPLVALLAHRYAGRRA
jgi:hypothetical protein